MDGQDLLPLVRHTQFVKEKLRPERRAVQAILEDVHDVQSAELEYSFGDFPSCPNGRSTGMNPFHKVQDFSSIL